MIPNPIANPFAYNKVPTSESNTSNPLKASDSPHIKLKESLKLDLKPKMVIKPKAKVKPADAARLATVHAFAGEEQTQNPELTKKAKLMNNRISFTDSLDTVQFYKALKDDSLKILSQQKPSKGSMYVKDLWGKNYYNRVVKKSGIERILDDIRRKNWQNKDEVLMSLDKTYRKKHPDDLGYGYMDRLVKKYKEKYGGHQSFGTPGNRSISTSRRNSVHHSIHNPQHSHHPSHHQSQFSHHHHEYSQSHREPTHSQFHNHSTASKTPAHSKLKLPNIHDGSGGSEYFINHKLHEINGTKSARHNYEKIHHIATGGDHHHHLHHDSHHDSQHDSHHYLQNPKWMEDSASDFDSESARSFHENDVFWAEIEDIHDQCNTARASTHDLKKKIEFLEKFMHLSLAKDRKIKISFAHKMKADTIKDFQSLIKHTEKFEDLKLKEIKSNFEKRRDDIIKQALENPHKHHLRPTIHRPQFHS